MTSKWARLITAVTDAVLNKGVSQNGLARSSGVPQSMISAAILGKYDLKEEKWRLICESLGLSYDEIIADVPEKSDGEDAEAATQNPPSDCSPSEAVSDAPVCEDTPDGYPSSINLGKAECKVAARYLAAKLKEDIRRGMDISLDDLLALLEITKIMGTC